MKIIIAGSRTITEYEIVLQAIQNSGFEITEIVSGKARGVDTLGERYAKENNIPIKEFPADWDNIDVEGAVIRIHPISAKKYNVKAGFVRNAQMAEYADGLIAITNGSSGTADMIKEAKRNNLKIYVETLVDGAIVPV